MLELNNTITAELPFRLQERVGEGNLGALNSFIARVIDAKTARIKTGDVGAARLIAPLFTPGATRASAAGRAKSGTGDGEMPLRESITGSEGFVRLGPRRGFHLLLVREEQAGFVPVFPDLIPGQP